MATVLSDNGGMALTGTRFSLHDITIDDISALKYHGTGGLFQVFNNWSANVLDNIAVNHITAFPDPRGHFLSLGNFTTLPSMWGFTFTNNLILSPKYPVWSTGGGSTNCAHLDVPLTSLSACYPSGYSFVGNALIGVDLQAYPTAVWPAANYFPASVSTVQFVNYNNGDGGDYHLFSSSPYKNAGTDGKDIGADIDAIRTATANAY